MGAKKKALGGAKSGAAPPPDESVLPPAKSPAPARSAKAAHMPADGGAKVPPKRLRDFIKVPKSVAYGLCAVLLLFSLGGILAAIMMGLSGLKLLSPVLLGPGLTVFGLGLLYDFTIRPLAAFHEELHAMIARTYLAIGGLFSILGLVFWYVG